MSDDDVLPRSVDSDDQLLPSPSWDPEELPELADIDFIEYHSRCDTDPEELPEDVDEDRPEDHELGVVGGSPCR